MATRYNLFLILVFSLYSVTCGVTDFFEHDIIRDVIRMKRQTHLFSKFEPAKNSIGGHIVKRETQDQCQAQKSKYLSKLNSDPPKNFNSSFSLQGDTHGYLSLAWCGVDDIVAVTTESFIYDAQSVVYISTDSGKSFINISTQVKNAHIRGDVGLQQHPFDDKRVYLIAYNQKNTSRSVLYSSVNSGKSFTQIGLDFVLSSPIHFHPNSKYTDFMMVVSDSKLYISKNNGKSWEKIREKVQSVKWGSVDDDTPPTIYCVVQVSDDQFSFAKIFGNDIRDNDLEQSLNWGKDWNKLRKHVFGFGVKGKFLYVSTFLTQEAEESGKRRLEVSKDRGATWYEVQLPAIEPERFYSILDMTDDRVFIHVDEPGTQGYGTLYTSDSTGIIYTESLKRHVFNILSGYTDFYPVKSMRGVYITSQMEENNEIHTMISYDRGGEWNTIQQPGGTICTDPSKKVCNLQIHGIYSLLRRNYKSNLPLSVDSAKGLLLAHGHVGATLDKTTPDVYLSTNGGYNWNKVLDGPHHYQIADQGGLLVAVPLEDYPKVVKFSTDEGGCWHEYTFTNDDIQFAGLLTAPGNSEMVLALWGYDKTTRFWKVTVVDFSKLVTETCKDPDYVTWTPHITNERTGCFLGMKEKFRKIKKDSW